MRFYLDEHLSPTIARIAQSFGLDVVCTADRERGGALDDVQLVSAAEEGRVVVTRNRDDFIGLTFEFMHLGLPHTGVLIINQSLPDDDLAGIARALGAYAESHPDGMPPYTVDWLKPAPDWNPPSRE